MTIQKDHIVQLWHYVDTLDEEAVLELIEEMAPHYPDPEHAEITFIALWKYFDDGGMI
jgi:hypothetical protein